MNADPYWRPYPMADTVAEIRGSIAIPSITVGRPSNLAEPSPIDQTFRPMPFRPDTVIDGWSTKDLLVRGASLRGHLHRFNGAPREDDFGVHRLPDGRVIVLVADGVSEARQSHLGSAVAIRAAAEWLHSSLPDDTQRTDWQHCFASVAWAINEQAQRLLTLAEPDARIAEETLATTLVCAVVEAAPYGALAVSVARVGDSGAWLLSGGDFMDAFQTATDSRSSVSSSEVVGLPRVPKDVVPVHFFVRPGEILLVGTDGFSDPLGDGSGGVGNLFRACLENGSPPSLLEFAHALDFSRESFDDDRTLVAIWPNAQRNHLEASG